MAWRMLQTIFGTGAAANTLAAHRSASGGSRLGSKPENVPVGIGKFHLVGPWAIPGFLNDSDSFGAVFVEQRVIFEPDPNPGGLSRILLPEHDWLAVPRHPTHLCARFAAPVHREPQRPGIKADAFLQISNRQDRNRAFHDRRLRVHGCADEAFGCPPGLRQRQPVCAAVLQPSTTLRRRRAAPASAGCSRKPMRFLYAICGCSTSMVSTFWSKKSHGQAPCLEGGRLWVKSAWWPKAADEPQLVPTPRGVRIALNDSSAPDRRRPSGRPEGRTTNAPRRPEAERRTPPGTA